MSVEQDLAQYLDFEGKASGGPGDEATGTWLQRRLDMAGFKTARQAFEVPFLEGRTCLLTVGGAAIPPLAQAPWKTTLAGGVSGRLTSPDNAKAGDIVVAELSFRRWSTAVNPEVTGLLAAAKAAHAVGVILITNGPSGEALALNALPVLSGAGDLPLAILAPKDAAPVRAAVKSASAGKLELTGATGMRPAWNLIGRIDRGHDRWVVVSTPRSGWFTCGGERGGGIAVWLDLAAWAPAALPGFNLAFLSTSGHEFENHGGHQAIRDLVPKPAETALWLHLGANVAARDWHELGPNLLPLPSADSQRLLVASPALMTAARQAFAGLPGLESPYPASAGAAGELGEILKAGYPSAAGIFGAHRLHHAAIDDERALSAPLVEAAALAARSFMTRALG